MCFILTAGLVTVKLVISSQQSSFSSPQEQTNAPFRPLGDQRQNTTFNYLTLGDNLKAGGSPSPADLAETMEVQWTQDIIDLAADLGNSPLAIYRYVKNHIDYQPYYGSLKGAAQTLKQRGGNDLDTASLLIALLRSPNVQVPCRYAGSYIKVTVPDVLTWLKLDDIATAINILNDAGIPAVLVDGNTKVQLVHYWVHAYVPYGNYRGHQRDSTEKAWVQLDPSFKQYVIQGGLSYSDEVPFDSTMKDDYYSELREETAIDYYLTRVNDFLVANHPGTSLSDLRRRAVIRPEILEFAPISLPYWVNMLQMVEGPALNDTYRYKIRFHLTENGYPILDHTLVFPERYPAKTTLSFQPATAGDQQTISNYGGFYQTPPNLIMVKPVLSLASTPVIAGASLSPGLPLELSISLTLPGLAAETIHHHLNSGGYYAFVFDPIGSLDDVLAEHYSAMKTVTAGTYDYYSDLFLGELLTIAGLEYWNEFERTARKLEDITHHVYNKGLSEVMVGQGVSVEWSGETPISLKASDYFVDVKRHVAGYYPTSEHNRERELYSLEFMSGSFFEHWILDRIGPSDGISTVKVIQLSRQNGLTLHQITYEDLLPGGELDQLAISDDIKSVIALEITTDLSGTPYDLIVTVPYDEITYNQWTGTGWVGYDPIVMYETYSLYGEFSLLGGQTTRNDPCADGNNCTCRVKILWPFDEEVYSVDSTADAWAFYWDMSGSDIPYTLTWSSNLPTLPEGAKDEGDSFPTGDTPGHYQLVCDAVNNYGQDQDRKDIIVVKVAITDTPSDYVPTGNINYPEQPGNTILYTVTITPGEDKTCSTITFEILDSSSYTGIAMNYGSQTDEDFHLRQDNQSDGNVMIVDKLKAETWQKSTQAEFIVSSFDFGGRAVLWAIVHLRWNRILTALVYSHDKENVVLIPQEWEEPNGIPDCGWDYHRCPDCPQGHAPDPGQGHEGDDIDPDPVGQNRPGDNLSALEEYRGVVIRHRNVHRRLDPQTKDVFITADAFNDITFAYPELPTATHMIYLNDVDKKLEINFNRQNLPITTNRCLTINPVNDIIGIPGTTAFYSFGPGLPDHIPNNILYCTIDLHYIETHAPSGTSEGEIVKARRHVFGHECGHGVGMSPYEECANKSCMMYQGFSYPQLPTDPPIPTEYCGSCGYCLNLIQIKELVGGKDE